jgi:glucan 1,3-beta-glucosidase
MPISRWGPTMCGEWSQADTDCAQYLNNVGVGSRWTGTMNTQDPSTQVLSPTCPQSSNSAPCDCGPANADPSSYTPEYKKFLQTFAEAQMNSFEKGWGWFYWTWETESAVQWSWKLGLQAGILPAKAYQPNFTCGDPIPSLGSLPENY